MELIREANPIPWEDRLCSESAPTFEKFTEVCRENGIPLTPSHYLGLGLVNRQGLLTNLGLLLSDQNPRHIKVGTFSRQGLLEKQELSGSIAGQIVECFGILDAFNPSFIKKTEKLASDVVRAWPAESLREALINCIAHRDYRLEFETTVSLRPEQIEFVSYGSIIDNLSVEDALQEGTGRCRNPKLASVFQRLHWMENFGTGFPDILKAYGRSANKPEISASRRQFSIRLPRASVFHPQSAEDAAQVLSRKAEWSAAELQTEFGCSRSAIVQLLRKLQDEGRVVRVGGGRSTRYRWIG